MLDDIHLSFELFHDECPCCGEDTEHQLCGTCEAFAERAWDEALAESDPEG
jgi:hypothetical protein